MDNEENTSHILEKIEELEDYLQDKKCILAFSAGSDSTLLAYILSEVSPNSKLVTIDNMMMTSQFIEYAKQKAQEFKLQHEIITLNFIEDEKFIRNDDKRCYNCRDLMYHYITQLEDFSKYDYFIEGTNITDLLEDRPGTLIRKKYNMTSPLIECEITKQDVFELISHLGLEYSNNTTCLSTRVKTYEKLSKKKLELIDKSEKLLRENIQQENIRLRFDNYTGTITVDNPLEILDKKLLEKLRDKLLEFGLKKVHLDITGYEKSKFEAIPNSDGTYYYQLPYEINLEETYRKLGKNMKYNDNVKMKRNFIEYDDIKINKDGKICIGDKDNFTTKFKVILPDIERKI